MQHQDSLPSIDNVAASDSSRSRLPSYRETGRCRFHPYSRPIPDVIIEEDSLLNSIYDEHVISNVPPLPARPVVRHPLVPQVIDEFEERLRQSLERVIAFELRVERLPTVFVEFVAGITRGTRG